MGRRRPPPPPAPQQQSPDAHPLNEWECSIQLSESCRTHPSEAVSGFAGHESRVWGPLADTLARDPACVRPSASSSGAPEECSAVPSALVKWTLWTLGIRTRNDGGRSPVL